MWPRRPQPWPPDARKCSLGHDYLRQGDRVATRLREEEVGVVVVVVVQEEEEQEQG